MEPVVRLAKLSVKQYFANANRYAQNLTARTTKGTTSVEPKKSAIVQRLAGFAVEASATTTRGQQTMLYLATPTASYLPLTAVATLVEGTALHRPAND